MTKEHFIKKWSTSKEQDEMRDDLEEVINRHEIMKEAQADAVGRSKQCEHPWSDVLGDGEMQPAKCLKCGEILS